MTSEYIEVYRPIAGWKWQLLDDDEGPIETSDRAWHTFAEAEADARSTAEDLDIPYHEYTDTDKDEIDDCNVIDKLKAIMPDIKVINLGE